MARGPVWIEAYEQYLLRKNVCEKSELERLSVCTGSRLRRSCIRLGAQVLPAVHVNIIQVTGNVGGSLLRETLLKKGFPQQTSRNTAGSFHNSMTSVYLNWCTEVFCILVR